MTEFLPWYELAGLLIGGALAFYYAKVNPENRARNALISLVLVSLAVYRFTSLQ
ncbi:MAG: hypothetical protein JO056_04090 [Alphaproteobacteria bacterium]|jgi:hypothetical protein|nr:hypothetical protein [Alphaproteobacteria bacterium]